MATDDVPRLCTDGHSMITWFDPQITDCPICELMADIKKISNELETAKNELEAVRQES